MRMSGKCENCRGHVLESACKSLCRHQKKRFKTMWKKTEDKPEDDRNYLVCWLREDGTFSAPHRAYFLEDEGHFFSLENNNSHPIVADIFYELPTPNFKDIYD